MHVSCSSGARLDLAQHRLSLRGWLCDIATGQVDTPDDARVAGVRRGAPSLSVLGLRTTEPSVPFGKLVFGKEARRRSVVFAEPKCVSENLRCAVRFALAACENAAHSSRPRAGCHCVHARSAALVERPIGNRDARIDRDVRMGDEENRRIGAPISC